MNLSVRYHTIPKTTVYRKNGIFGIFSVRLYVIYHNKQQSPDLSQLLFGGNDGFLENFVYANAIFRAIVKKAGSNPRSQKQRHVKNSNKFLHSSNSINHIESTKMLIPASTALIIILTHFSSSAAAASLCRTFCNNIPIRYPFGIDDGCGAAPFRRMLNCSTAAGLFFLTPSGSYKVQSIDYGKKTVVLYDPSMSTCSILQPHRDFLITDIQSATIPPSPDTLFLLLNCSLDSPLLNRYRYLCSSNFSAHSCDELYATCTSFKLFHMLSNSTASPPCCFTTYDTLRYMSMNILDCSHYTSVYNVDALKGVGPLDWLYGIKLSYSLPDLGCDRCSKSGGVCGFDVDTQGFTCICSFTTNATTDCGGSYVNRGGKSNGTPSVVGVAVLICRALFLSLPTL
ncbi:uncharacterized protein LOC121767518 isoform X2 [Salvia splendens]|uniref:uncharacterized protein LOC121767518 isoform X2 n=1 Tax=Salvia splendens TaxID=180675 RepID=UPI001C272FAD|nr:uncharacterized protein LOC121767518 isoform X2 [Salvia splendens]